MSLIGSREAADKVILIKERLLTLCLHDRNIIARSQLPFPLNRFGWLGNHGKEFSSFRVFYDKALDQRLDMHGVAKSQGPLFFFYDNKLVTGLRKREIRVALQS
jgi:hypothetical protein